MNRGRRRRPSWSSCWLVRVATIAVLASTVGCTSGAGQDSGSLGGSGPLEPPGDTATQCVAKKGQDRVVIGFEVLRNNGDRDVVIDHVTLEGARNVRLIGSRLSAVRNSGGTLMGDWFGLPPRISLASSREQWKRSTNANGAVLSPRRTSEVILVLDTGDRADASTIDHVRVGYHVAGERDRFVRDGNISYRFQPGTSCS